LIFHFLVDLGNQLCERSLLVIPSVLPFEVLYVVTVRYDLITIVEWKSRKGSTLNNFLIGLLFKGNFLKLLASVLEVHVNLRGLLVQDHKLVNASNLELLLLDLLKMVQLGSSLITRVEFTCRAKLAFGSLLVLAFNVGGNDIEHTLNYY